MFAGRDAVVIATTGFICGSFGCRTSSPLYPVPLPTALLLSYLSEQLVAVDGYDGNTELRTWTMIHRQGFRMTEEDTETDLQTDTQTNTQTQRFMEVDLCKDTKTHRVRHTQTNKQTQRCIYRGRPMKSVTKTHRARHRRAGSNIHRQTCIARHSDTQPELDLPIHDTDRFTYTHTSEDRHKEAYGHRQTQAE